MPYDFQSWKRKLGVLTLAIACLFMAGWLRSLSEYDEFELPSAPRKVHQLTSTDGALEYWAGTWITEPHRFSDGLQLTTPFTRVTKLLTIPYWLIVVPMTLLSVWLLLSKPQGFRKAEIQSKSTQPEPRSSRTAVAEKRPVNKKAT